MPGEPLEAGERRLKRTIGEALRHDDTKQQGKGKKKSTGKESQKQQNKRKAALGTITLEELIAKRNAANNPPRHTVNDNHALGPPSEPQIHMVLNARKLAPNMQQIVMDIRSATTPHMQLPSTFTLTETNLYTCQKNTVQALKRALPEYAIWSSGVTRNKARQGKRRSNRAHSGVVVGVLRKHIPAALSADAARMKVPPTLQGHALHIRIAATQGPTMNIVGIYSPCCDKKQATRQAIWAYMKETATKVRTRHESLLMMGDWNAAPFPGDRWDEAQPAPRTPTDKAFQCALAAASLSPISGEETRFPTYEQYSHGHRIHASRIDDVLTLAETAQALHATRAVHTWARHSGGSPDHKILLCQTNHPHTHLPMGVDEDTAAKEHAKRLPRIPLPISKEDAEVIRSSIEEQLGNSFQIIMHKMASIKDEIANGSAGGLAEPAVMRASAREVLATMGTDVELLATELTTFIQKASNIMYQICARPTPPADRKPYLPRALQRKCQQTYQQLQALKEARSAAYEERKAQAGGPAPARNQRHQQTELRTDVGGFEEDIASLLRQRPTTSTNEAQWREWLGHVEEKRKELHARSRLTSKEAKQRALTKATTRLRRLLATRPKLGHRKIFEDMDGDSTHIAAIRHPTTGATSTDTPGILDGLHTYFTNLLSIPQNAKTGEYTPEKVARNYPWEGPGARDPFHLQSAARPQGPNGLFHRILDPVTFTSCLNHLKRNKKPGPDGIYNELLQQLPDAGKQALHSLMAIMWAAGHTPKEWKASHTTLIFKKEDPANPKNYRPIALANTMYKLWTSVITTAASSFAENNHIINSYQEGFRLHRNTTRQLQNYLHIIEDAALTNKDLYATYIDLSCAFNTVDHDRLLWVMHDLGLPTDLIDIVKDLYTDATTTIATTRGLTANIPIHRGNIQGDTLSPFLFLVYMEPLLRWLRSGGHGYRYGCLSDEANHKHNCPALAYADDLVLTTNTKDAMAHQWRKVSQYMKWSGMSINAKKCAATCVLHDTQPRAAADIPRHIVTYLTSRLNVGGIPIPFLLPTEAYKYLGVWITLTLNWGTHMSETVQRMKEWGARLAASLTPLRQRKRIIMSKIRAAMAYPLPVAIYTTDDLARLDSCLCSITKQCLNLPRGLSNAAVMRDNGAGGLGVTSLLVDYVQQAGDALVRCLNDTEHLGCVGRALLDMQTRLLGDLPVLELAREARYYTVLRQLSLLKDQNLQLLVNGTPYSTPEHELWNFAQKAVAAAANQVTIPAHLFATLGEVGVHSINDVLTPDGKQFIMADNMKGKFTSAGKQHMIALNRLTLLVTGYTTVEKALSHDSPETLTPRQRLLPMLPDVCNAYLQTQNVRTGRQLTQITMQEAQRRQAERARQDERAWQEGQQAAQEHVGTPQNPADEPPNETDLDGERGRKRYARGRVGAAALSRATYKANVKHKVQLNQSDIVGDAQACINFLSEHAELCQPNLSKEMLLRLYDGQDRVDAILATEQRSHGLTQATRKRSRVTQYLVQWGDTIVHRNHLDALRQKLKDDPRSLPLPYPTPDAPSHVDMVRVQWTPTWTRGCDEDVDFAAALAAYNRARDDETAAARGRPRADPELQPKDSHLTNLQKQGVYNTGSTSWDGYDAETRQALNKCVTFNPHPCNPDQDIAVPSGPPARHRIQVGRWVPGQYGDKQEADLHTAFVYQPNGMCLGGIPTGRMMFLTKWYFEYRKRTEKPTFSLAEEVARLLSRHKPTKHMKAAGKKLWGLSLPPKFISALTRAGGAYIERFATPLTAQCPIYYSTHQEDEVFGARGTPYSTAWTGCSVAVPPLERDALCKALRWAIACAEGTTEPSLTYLVCPAWGGAHTKFTSHPYVYTVDYIEPGDVTFLKYNPQLENNTEEVRNDKFGVYIYAVANTAGLHKYIGRSYDERCYDFRLKYRTCCPTTPNDEGEEVETGEPLRRTPKCTWGIPRQREDNEAPIPAPKKLAAMLLSCVEPPAHPEYNEAITASRIRRMFPADLPLAVDPRTAIYTDGSCITSQEGPNRCAAAVYIPDPMAPLGSRGAARVIRVNPGGKGPTNTINRAELSAIAAALDEAERLALREVAIFTDSLCSIYMIMKMAWEPHLMRQSKHRHLLARIVELIVARSKAGRRTSLHKVPAHSGVLGNEEADAAATSMARGEASEDQCFQEPTTSDPYNDMVWIGRVSTTEDGQTEVFYVSDLTSSLKRLVHPECQDGFCNKTGVYAEANKQTTLISSQIHSTHAWTSSEVSFKALLTTLKARWGQLYNQKLAVRYHLAATDACPLCGQHDSAGHILGGCAHPVLKAMHIKRHNIAVQKIFKAIQKHSHWGGYFGIMDACPREDAASHGAADTRLPTWLLPDITDEERNKLRPDILIVEGLRARHVQDLEQDTKFSIHIVEVGYCSDSRRDERHQSKTTQHLTLRELLEARGHTVTIHTVLLGTCGTIFKDTAHLLKTTCRIPHSVVDRILNDLNCHAVNSAHTIVCKRRELERCHTRRTRTGVT
jgi:ribonuclease HI/exonuclease III